MGPFLPRATTHAAGTRPPAARANKYPACHHSGLPRTVLTGSTVSPHLNHPPLVWQAQLRLDSRFFASQRGAPPARARTRPLSPPHRPEPTPRAAARLSLRLRTPPRLLPPPSPTSRDLARVCAQAQFCSRRGPRRTRRTASTAPRTPPPLDAGSLRTTPTLPPLSHHSHPHLHPSPPSLLHPHPPPRASRHPTPLTPGGTARAAVLGPSCALVASLCIVSSKRSDLFRSRVRSEPTVTFPGRGRNLARNPGSGA